MEQELFAYWLYTLRGIGAKKRHELQQIYGNAEQIYYGDKTKLKESPVFSEQDKTLLGKPETVKENAKNGTAGDSVLFTGKRGVSEETTLYSRSAVCVVLPRNAAGYR